MLEKDTQSQEIPMDPLVPRLNAKDPAAWETLAERCLQGGVGYVMKRIGDKDIADDLVQESLLRLYAREEPLYGNPMILFYRILGSRLIDHIRGKRVTTSYDETFAEQPSSAGNPEDIAIRRENGLEVHEALHDIASDQQQVLVLNVLQELSIAEVAARMDRTESATRVLKTRALRSAGRRIEAQRNGTVVDFKNGRRTR